MEKLNLFLDLLQSYRVSLLQLVGCEIRISMPTPRSLPALPPQDLCERHEKGVLHEHQRALHKYSVMKRQMMSATVQPKEQASVEQLESRIVQVALRPSKDPLQLLLLFS